MFRGLHNRYQQGNALLGSVATRGWFVTAVRYACPFNTLSMNLRQPKILCSIQNQEVCIRFSLIKLTWSVFLLCSKTQPWLKCSRQMTLSHPRHHVSTPPSKFPHLIKVLRFLHWFAASPFIGRDCFANISRERKQLNRLSLKLGPSLRWPRVNLNGNTHEVWPW